jgi:hypothetical protein
MDGRMGRPGGEGSPLPGQAIGFRAISSGPSISKKRTAMCFPEIADSRNGGLGIRPPR